MASEGPPVDPNQVYSEGAVDEPVEALYGLPLTYPRKLQEKDIEGFAIVQFVVDTTGRPEPATIRTVQATHDQFGDEAEKSVRGSRYRPGRLRGVPVRVLVRQQFDFELAK